MYKYKTIFSKNGYSVYKSFLSDEEIKKTKDDLCVEPIVNFETQYQVNNSFKVYKENEQRFRVPRYYGLHHFGIPQKTHDFQYTHINLKFKGNLNAKTFQDIAVEKSLKQLFEHPDNGGGGILSLPPGFGKTTVSLYLISQVKAKSLIIVHKEFLLNQWIERIKMFLPEASVGTIRQDKVDIEGKDIVIGMLQSLCMKDYPNGTFDSFGFTIIDETHHICSKVFSKALSKFTTKHILGLSATPHRKDGLTKVLEWYIGPIFYSLERENQKTVKVDIINYNHSSYTPDNIPKNKANKVSNVEIITNLVKLKERNEAIIEQTIKLYKNGRNVMILSDRREHCFELQKQIDNLLNESVCGLYMGGMKQNELNESEKKDIIIATYSLAHEGLDIPKLDSLILSTPKTDVVQACGRIMRETHGKKFDPYIIDIVDNIGPLKNQGRKRQIFYKKSGFNITYNNSSKDEYQENVYKPKGKSIFVDDD